MPNDDSLTFAEKIISIKADGGRKVHNAGEIAVLPGDMAMAQDSTGPLAIKVFREMGVQKVWDPKKIHLVIDHSFPAPDEKVANLHIMIREFVKQQGVRLVHRNIRDRRRRRSEHHTRDAEAKIFTGDADKRQTRAFARIRNRHVGRRPVDRNRDAGQEPDLEGGLCRTRARHEHRRMRPRRRERRQR